MGKALGATLCNKDEEIETLLKQRTQELEDEHKKSIETQALQNAAMLKEVTDEVAGVATAKAGLEILVGKLKEELAGRSKEIKILKGEAQKKPHSRRAIDTAFIQGSRSKYRH